MNVANFERWASAIGGGLLALYGIRERNLPGLGLALVGGALLERGMTGHCALYSALGVSTEQHGRIAAVAAGRGIKVVRAITIQRSAADLYAHWRNFDNLPRFMNHLVSIQTNGIHSHWVAHAPAGMTVEWDAEIVSDEPKRLIAWRSLSGSEAATAGSVHFTTLPDDRGTEVHIVCRWTRRLPPTGRFGTSKTSASRSY